MCGRISVAMGVTRRSGNSRKYWVIKMCFSASCFVFIHMKDITKAECKIWFHKEILDEKSFYSSTFLRPYYFLFFFIFFLCIFKMVFFRAFTVKFSAFFFPSSWLQRLLNGFSCSKGFGSLFLIKRTFFCCLNYF